LQYLCNKYDKENKFYPVEAEARAKVDYLLNYDLGTLYKAIGEYVYPIWLYKQAPDEEKMKVLFVLISLVKFLGDGSQVRVYGKAPFQRRLSFRRRSFNR